MTHYMRVLTNLLALARKRGDLVAIILLQQRIRNESAR